MNFEGECIRVLVQKGVPSADIQSAWQCVCECLQRVEKTRVSRVEDVYELMSRLSELSTSEDSHTSVHATLDDYFSGFAAESERTVTKQLLTLTRSQQLCVCLCFCYNPLTYAHTDLLSAATYVVSSNNTGVF